MTDYYVATNGNNSTGNGSIELPWATIQYAATQAVAGDRVIIRGGTYPETITPPNSGSSGNPIIFKAYSGEVVNVVAYDRITTAWEVHSGGIYKTQLSAAWDVGAGRNLLFNGNDPLCQAMWPALPEGIKIWEFARKYCAISQSGSLGASQGGGLYRASYTHPDIGALPDLVGATLRGAPGWEWIGKIGTVVSHTGNTFEFDFPRNAGDTAIVPGANDPFILTGLLSLLAEGQWFFDRNTYILYYWPPTGSLPTDFNLGLRKRQKVLDIASGKNYLTFQGINFIGGEIEIRGNYATFQNRCHFISNSYYSNLIGGQGITITGGATNLTIQNCNISKCSGNGITLQSGSGHLIEDCVLEDVGYFGGNGIECAGNPRAQNVTVRRNSLANTGGHGINFGAIASLFHNNLITGWCGCIYDTSALNTWNSGELGGTELYYNFVSIDRGIPFDNTWGGGKYLAAGSGFRWDAGVTALGGITGLGVFDSYAHHNIFRKLNRFGAALWGRPAAVTDPGTGLRLKFYHNDVMQGGIELPDGATDYTGMRVVNNIGGTYLDDKSAAGCFYRGNLTFELESNFIAPDLGDFQLKADSAAIAAGVTDEGATVDLGAVQTGQSWVAGALITEEDFDGLSVQCEKISETEIICTVGGFPKFRLAPLNFQVRVGSAIASEPQNATNLQTGATNATFFLDPTGLSGIQPIEIRIGSGSWVSKGSIDLSGTTTPDTLYRQLIVVANSTGLSLSSYNVPVYVDTAALVTTGKMNAQGGMRFFDGEGYLHHWIDESTWNTATTRIWLQVNQLEPGNNSIYLIYGASLSRQSSGENTFPIFFNDFTGGYDAHFERFFNFTNPSRTDLQVAVNSGYLKFLADTTLGGSAPTTADGINFENAYIPFPDKSAIDTGISLPVWNYSGGEISNGPKIIAGSQESIIGATSNPTSARRISYFSGNLVVLGDSTMDGQPFGQCWVSNTYLKDAGLTTVQWYEDGVLKAQNPGLSEPARGRFSFAPGVSNAIAELWVDYIFVRKVVDAGVALSGNISGSEESWVPPSYPFYEPVGFIAPSEDNTSEIAPRQKSRNTQLGTFFKRFPSYARRF